MSCSANSRQLVSKWKPEPGRTRSVSVQTDLAPCMADGDIRAEVLTFSQAH